MGIDLASQKIGTIPGCGRFETGYFDISADSWTVEVPTRLAHIDYGHGIVAYDYTAGGFSAGYTPCTIATCDGSISTTGNVTMRRLGTDKTHDQRFYYIFVGW